MKRSSFKSGDFVYHLHLGLGVIVEEWGCWIDLDDRGNALMVNGAGVYVVAFSSFEPADDCTFRVNQELL